MYTDESSDQAFAASAALSSQAHVQNDYLNAAKDMTSYQQKIAQLYLDQHNTLVQNVLATKEELDLLSRQMDLDQRRQDNFIKTKMTNGKEANLDATNQQYETKTAARTDLTNFRQLTTELDNVTAAFDNFLNVTAKNVKGQMGKIFTEDDVDRLQKNFKAVEKTIVGISGDFDEAFGEKAAPLMKQLGEAIGETSEQFDSKKYIEARNALVSYLDKTGEEADGLRQKLMDAGIITEDYAKRIDQASSSHQVLINELVETELSAQGFAVKLANISTNISSFAQNLQQCVQLISQFTAIINAGVRFSEILSDKDLSG